METDILFPGWPLMYSEKSVEPRTPGYQLKPLLYLTRSRLQPYTAFHLLSRTDDTIL